MTKAAFFEKLAETQPSFESWGLPDDKRYPLDTAEHVKMAEARFPDLKHDVKDRVVLAQNMAKRAGDLGLDLDPKIAAITGNELNPDFDSHIVLRKSDSAHMRDDMLDHLKKLAHAADTFEGLVKVAQTLQAFDRDLGIEEVTTDPAVAVFGRGVDPFHRKMPVTEFDSVKLAGLEGVVSDEALEHLKGGGSVAELPWTTREVVGSFLRDA